MYCLVANNTNGIKGLLNHWIQAFLNKARYTAVKVLDKLADKQAYLNGG